MNLVNQLKFFCIFVLIMCAASHAYAINADLIAAYQVHQTMFMGDTNADLQRQHEKPSPPNWTLVTLPHNWDHAHNTPIRHGWYHIDYTPNPTSHQLYGIYLPRLNMNAAVYINGALLDSGGTFQEPIARNWNRPLFFSIPEGMLHTGVNNIVIHVKGYLNSGAGLGHVYIGPAEILKKDYRWHYHFFISTTIVSCSMTVALSFAMFLFWYLRREKMFLWFALANALSAFYLSNHFIQHIPVSRHLWEWAFNFSIDGFVLCLMFFTHRWLKLNRSRLEWYATLYLACAMTVLFFLPEAWMIEGFNSNHSVFIGIGAYISWLLLKTWFCQKNHWLLLPLAAFFVNVLLAVHDWLQLINGRANNDYYMPLGEPLMLLVISGFLVRYFVLMHQRSDQFSIELQEKVIQTTAALEAKHHQLKALENQQLIEHERERILHELHDGIGGQLISAISLADKIKETPALKQTLQDALLDLRLVIDSLDEDGRDLSNLLGMLRMRLTPQLQAHHVQLRWNINPNISTKNFSYEVSLNILRIVQEAISNALRHACAVHIELGLDRCQHSGGVAIEIIDDGCGMNHAPTGRGIGHMQERSKRIGAKLDIKSSSYGTHIILYLPLDE